MNTRARGYRPVVVVVGTRTRGLSPRQEGAALSPRPRALEEADRVCLVQYRRRRGPVVFGDETVLKFLSPVFLSGARGRAPAVVKVASDCP